MLFDHLSTHVSCDYDDCDFVGVAAAVTKHKREEHEQPESLTVFAMDHPAILQAWLQERRKKFPSSGNVKLKQLREQAKIDHGLIAREKSYTFKDRKWGVKRHKPCIPEREEPKSPDKPQPNDPLSFILNSGEAKPVPEPTCVLGLGAYDSSSDSDKEPKEADLKPVETAANEPNVEFALRKFKRYAKMRAADGKKRKHKHKWNGVMKSGRRRYQPTLLQKLLSRDIVREHNTVLQCIRYIVSNNFFDKPVVDSNSSGDVVTPQSQSEMSGPPVSCTDKDHENSAAT